MTRINRSKRFFIIFSFFVLVNVFTGAFVDYLHAATETTWTIAAEKFEIKTSGENIDSVQSAIQEMIPSRIIDNLSSSSYRTISGDEEFDRTYYKLKNERISLFLQLSSAIRAKDSIFLNDYSEKKIQSLKKEEDKKIKVAQDKIDENLQAQKDAEEKAIKKSKGPSNVEVKTEGQKYINLLKGLVSSEDLSLVNERVVIYEKGDSSLYTPSIDSKKNGYTSHAFEKEMANAKINSLITGRISIFGDYMAVTVEMFVYPGCKSVGVVTEVGSMNDVDFISSSIARQISPWISASMPVVIKLNLQPEDAMKTVRFSIDDIVYRNLQDEYIVDSGVHSIRFDASGYKTAITSFNFVGNTVYNIDVELQTTKDGVLFIEMKQPLFGINKTGKPFGEFKKNNEPLEGSVYTNGEFEQKIEPENQIAKIKINGSIILGQFIGSDGGSGFYYVPEKLLTENTVLDVKLKTFDRSDYIEKRRRLMYTSYSVFVVSLLGYIFTNANAKIYSDYYYSTVDDLMSDASNPEFIKKANSWILASNILAGVTIGSGGWFGFELYRYLSAADSVLPSNAKNRKGKSEKNKKEEE